MEMRVAQIGMQTVFIIAGDMRLRTGVRAELRERNIDALGMEMTQDMRAALARGLWPDLILLEDSARAADDSVLRRVAQRVPVVLVASRLTRQDFPYAREVLSRPVAIADIVAAVLRRLEIGAVASSYSGGRRLADLHAASSKPYATIPRMEQKSAEKHGEHAPQPQHGSHATTATGPMIHRVCIQCNNMFPVAAGDFATKQCPACHKD